MLFVRMELFAAPTPPQSPFAPRRGGRHWSSKQRQSQFCNQHPHVSGNLPRPQVEYLTKYDDISCSRKKIATKSVATSTVMKTASTNVTQLLQCTNSIIHRPEDACGDGIAHTSFTFRHNVKTKGNIQLQIIAKRTRLLILKHFF